jgi:thioredoxin 1
MMAPVIEEVNQEMSDSVKVLKVDVDQEGDLAREYKVTAIPTLVLIKNGKLVYSSMGFKPKNAIQELIRKNL